MKIRGQIEKSDRTLRPEISLRTILLHNSDLMEIHGYCIDNAHRIYLQNASNKES